MNAVNTAVPGQPGSVTSPEVLTRLLEALRAQQPAPAEPTIRLVTRAADPALRTPLPAGLVSVLTAATSADAGTSGAARPPGRVPVIVPDSVAALVGAGDARWTRAQAEAQNQPTTPGGTVASATEPNH